MNRDIKSQTEHGTLTEEGQRIVLRAAFERQSRHMCIEIGAVHEVIYTMVAITRNGTIVAEWMRRARTWRAATLMHTGAGHAPSRRPSGWRRLQDCNVALQSLLQQRDAPPSSRTPRGDKPKHCGLCMSFGLGLQLKSQNTNGTISHRASPFISALLSRSRSARVREAVTAKFAAVHTSANTAAGTAVNAARRGPNVQTRT